MFLTSREEFKKYLNGTKKPFIPINHLEGHLFSPSYNNKLSFPHLSLLITGGHTQIYLMKDKKSGKEYFFPMDDLIYIKN